MSSGEDTSGEHFDWLVEGRARNQKTTVRLYKIIEDQRSTIELNPAFERLARDLAAAAFSLWRAVFLTDLTGEVGDQLADLTRFLRSLLAHNAVLYRTDFNSREWAFTYYLRPFQTEAYRAPRLAGTRRRSRVRAGHVLGEERLGECPRGSRRGCFAIRKGSRRP